MGKKYSIADEGDDEVQSRKPGGDPDPDVEVEVDQPDGLSGREELSDEELFDDIVPASRKAPQPDDDDSVDEDDEDKPDDEDDEETDDEPVSKKDSFERRLARERRLLKETREETRELRAEIKHFKDLVLKKGAEQEFERLKAETDTKIADLKKQLTEAIEAGNTADQVEITEKLAEAKAELRAKEAELKRAKEAEATAPDTSRAQRAAQQWIRKHRRYHTDPVFKAAAIAIDKKLIAEGSDNADPDHFKQIDEELAKRFPEEYRKPRQRREAPTYGDRPTAGGERKQGGFIRRGKKIIISSRQAENMRRFGLDPENPDDVKSYVRENS